jgi:hypothetical protein
MNTPTVAAIVIALIVGIVIGAIFVYAAQRRRSLRLQERFGPEYSRTVTETGDQWKAESSLGRRVERVRRLHIRPLEPAERTRFLNAWHEIQTRFIDDPNGTLVDADQLIGQVMSTEGYPLQDFDQRAADISVDHPNVVENYRAGHRIALRHAEGRADTEELRRAMIHYRTLFEDLLGHAEYSRMGGTA